MRNYSLCGLTRRLCILLPALCVAGALSARNDTIIRHFTDTVTSVSQVQDSTLRHREEIIPADSLERRGHYLEAHVGLGYGSLGYNLSGAENYASGSFSALLQLQYAWFFHPNWGIGAGLWFTNYTSFGHIGGLYTWLDQTHTLGIPISLQFQYGKEDWKARLFAALGIAPAFSVISKYRLLEGTIDHSGYYPAWALTLEDMHEFGLKDYVNEPCARGPLSVRPQAAVFADFGALFPLNKQTDLLLGCYANVAVNDVNSSSRQNIGWKDEVFTFMDEYHGAYATTNASASHPWEAGIKIGIH